MAIPPLVVAVALGLGACSDNDNPEIGEEFEEQGEELGEELDGG